MRPASSGRRFRWLAPPALALLLTGTAPAGDDGWLPLQFAAALTSAAAEATPATEPPVMLVTGVPAPAAAGGFGQLQARPATPQVLWETARAAVAPGANKVNRKLTELERQLQTVAQTGQANLLGPMAGQRVLVLLVSPVLLSGQHWGPTAVYRRGRSVTVWLESWTASGARKSFAAQRHLYALDVGEWPAGDCQVQLRCTNWVRDQTPRLSMTLYRPRAGLTGATLAVPVAPAPPEGAAEPAPALAASDLAELPRQETPKPPAFGQLPRSSRRLCPWAKTAGPGIFAGGTDGSGALQSIDLTSGNVNALPQPAGTGDPAAVIVGPELRSDEGLTLTGIEWRDTTTAVVRVRLWRDHGPRTTNFPFVPVLVVPLSPPAGAGNQLTLLVDWSVLMAPTPGGPYEPDTGTTTALQQGPHSCATWTPLQ